MGILDDAIREHLELKRQHGAGSDDLERLEKEAFGAPARPGDPEFADPEAESEAVVAEPEDGAGETEAPAEPEADSDSGGTSDWLTGEEATTVAPVDAESADRARIEHPQLDDTEDHPAPEAEAEPDADADAKPAFEEPGPPSDATEAPAEAPPEAPERSIFDAEEIDLDEFDLELDDESAAPAEESAPEAPREVRRDPVVEDDTGEAPAPVQPREDSADGEEGEGEDLLGATPDFLQDAPEGEDLWFEQGPPKDFDFDDDDD